MNEWMNECAATVLLNSPGCLIVFVFVVLDCLLLGLWFNNLSFSHSPCFATRFSFAQCKHAIVVRRVFVKHMVTPNHLFWLTAVVWTQASICVINIRCFLISDATVFLFCGIRGFSMFGETKLGFWSPHFFRIFHGCRLMSQCLILNAKSKWKQSF